MRIEPPIPATLWDTVPADAQAALLAAFSALQQEIADLKRQVQDLQQRLGQNSTNSSKPPSSDGPEVKRAPPRSPTGRKSGGQPGHARQVRPRLTPDRTFQLRPSQCRSCHRPLSGDDPNPLIHQVLEIPPVKPDVTEYHLHRLSCPHCRTSTCATLPRGAALTGQGPRLQALIGLLTGAYRLSKRQVEQLLDDLFGLPLCAGTVCKLEGALAETLQPVVEEMREQLPYFPVNMDETTWRHNRDRLYLWVAVAPQLTVFDLADSRKAEVGKGLIGASYDEVLTTDRYSGYSWLPLSCRQICWSHLRRDFQAMIDAGQDLLIGDRLLHWSNELFHRWHQVRAGKMSRKKFAAWVEAEGRPRVHSWLKLGVDSVCAKTASMCAEILKVEEALWTFAAVKGVEPTNNAAERAFRHAVLWRKSSGGTKGKSGRRFVAAILSVVATCRQQGRNVWQYLTNCTEAVLRGLAAPSLLPQPQA
jgi:transposase